MRLRYLFVMAVLLIWVPSLLLKLDPRFHGLSIVIDLGCTLVVIISALSALFTRKWKALATFSVLLTVLMIGVCASFAYRLNNVCGPGDRIIESEADAIKQAQIRIIRARYGSRGIPGYVDEKPGYADFSRVDCCRVRRSRTAIGVVLWEVELHGETIGEPKKRYVSADMWLSNCGSVFDEDSSITPEPAR
jgi:hypothetical protein